MTFFDARTVTPDAGRGDPVPPAWYNAIVSKLTVEPTKDGNGTKANGEFEIVDGSYKGRKIFHNFNLKNNNELAQQIGQAQMSALCHAVKNLTPVAPEQLCNIPLKIRVKIKPAENGYDAKNEITSFKDINDLTISKVTPSTVVQTSIPVPPVMPAQEQPWAGVQQPWQQPPVMPAQAPVTAPVPVLVPQVMPVQQVQAPPPMQTTPVDPISTGGQVVPPWMTSNPS